MDDEIYLRTQHLAAINLVCLVAALIIHRRRCNRRRSIDPEMMLHNQKVRQEILHNLATSGKCRKLIRMSENAFMILCHKLKNECGLQATQLDGTHVRVRVSNKDAARYRGRKGYPTINVLCSCTFDLKFTYVLSGWEGTASDSRIIKDALTRDDKLVIPNGKFYLVDGGLPHRYHLKEYSSRGPQNKRELFNLRHASLWNSIERAFGVLKKKFAILRSSNEPFYSPEIQSDIFLTCCILHNFLQEVDRDQELEDKVARKILAETQVEEPHAPREIDDSGDQLRNSIADEMWNEYLLYQNNEIDMSI